MLVVLDLWCQSSQGVWFVKSCTVAALRRRGKHQGAISAIRDGGRYARPLESLGYAVGLLQPTSCSPSTTCMKYEPKYIFMYLILCTFTIYSAFKQQHPHT